MDAIGLLAECEAHGLRLEPRPGDKLGIVGPTDMIATFRSRIMDQKWELLALLAEPVADGCTRCGGSVHRSSLDGLAWCVRDDARRYCLDLAYLGGYPRLGLAPMLMLVTGGAGAWAELATSTAPATVYVAIRKLRER